MPSDIHVLVRFQNQCVFAGEELKCIITFKNVLDQLQPSSPGLPLRRNSRTTSIGKLTSAASRQPSAQSEKHALRATTSSRPHRQDSPQLGTTAVRGPFISGKDSPQSAPEGGAQQRRLGHKQQRSVSIISVASPVVSPGQNNFPVGPGQRPGGTHRRSSTVQVFTGMRSADSRSHHRG